MRKTFLAVIIFSVIFISCKKDSVCTYTDSTIVASANEVTDLQNYLTSQSITATSNPAGFFYKVTTVGTGTAVANLCTSITINYKGRFANGTIFDSTVTGRPAVFQLGQLIPGWQKGIPLISKGGKITLYIPPSLGYGSNDVKNQTTGAVIIPANSKLIFDIELVDVAN